MIDPELCLGQSSFSSQSPWPSKHWFEGLQQPLFSALHPLGGVGRYWQAVGAAVVDTSC